MKLDLISTTVLAITVAVVLIFWPRPGLAGRDHLNRYNYKTDQMTPQWRHPTTVHNVPKKIRPRHRRGR